MSIDLHPHAGKIIIPGTAPERAVDYNQTDFSEIVDEDERKQAITEQWIAGRIGEGLVGAYPGREWAVAVNLGLNEGQSGQVVIQCPSLSQTKGYVLHIDNNTITQLVYRAKKAAGEILERYGVSRGQRADVDAIEALERNPLNDEVVSSDAEVTLPSGKKA